MSGPVIALCGFPGSGKTTLARRLAQRLGAGLVEYDRFETFTRRPLPEVLDWLAAGAPYAQLQAPGLEEALRLAARGGAVVFDTPLGRAHPQTGGLIDRCFWLDCPADLALARKVAQLSREVPDADSARFVEWLSGYLALYPTITRPACHVQIERVVPLCDMTIDGTAGIDTILETLVAKCDFLKGA
ncbi:AAA family ATPase [Pseudotabrizicola algicola]|uniref:AAA family ATPase n=1 Tax=Pseudotabrizicola algicola TaxID=2709381 RepID=A0A6B3RNY9_9RHOB|nr:AAA family ATPase [Pseudotabrizicola algicola]NEX46558.1 AAA family ATPase [Pseudotabrizicola algicola]